MMRHFRLWILMLAVAGLSQCTRAQAPNAPNVPAPTAATSKAPQRSAAQWMERARKLKARGDYDGARQAVYGAMEFEEQWENPRLPYFLGWLAIAEKKPALATTHFRVALRDGLTGKEAVEARAALKRLGASEQFSRAKRRPRSPFADIMQRALMADYLKPGPLEWALQTALILGIAAVCWSLIALLGSWAARQKFGVADLKTVVFWCAALLVLRALGQFAVSFRHILPLMLAYLALGVGQLLAAIFYGGRRLVTKKVMDKGAILAWGAFYTLMFLVIAGGSTPFAPYFIGLALASALLWIAINPWFIAGQRAESRKRKGDLVAAAGIYESALRGRRLSDKTRFVIANDLASLHAAMGDFPRSIELSHEALRYVHAFKSAEVLPRLNLAESSLALGQGEEALNQLGQVWRLTTTGDCIMGGEQWQGIVHGILAMLNFWRGWSDEAVRQAELCLEAFPAEKRTNQSSKNLVGISRAIKGSMLLRAGETEAGRRYLEAAPKSGALRDALSFVQFTLSQMHERAGEMGAALQAAEAALLATPDYFPAQFQRADLIAQSGQLAQATQLLREALVKGGNHVLAPMARQKLSEWEAPVAASREASPLQLQPALAETQTMI